MSILTAKAEAIYKDDDRLKYLDNSFRLQIVAGRYKDALATIATLRESLSAQPVIPSRASWVNVQYEIYARAKIMQGAENLSYKDAYARAFRNRLARLDAWSAAQVIRALAFTDPADTQRELQNGLDKQKNADTISLADTLPLVSHYLLNQTYQESAPLNPALIAEDDERRYITETNILVKTPDGASICTFVMRPHAASTRFPALLNFSIYVGSMEAIEIRSWRRTLSPHWSVPPLWSTGWRDRYSRQFI
jgi:hypothetical protein